VQPQHFARKPPHRIVGGGAVWERGCARLPFAFWSPQNAVRALVASGAEASLRADAVGTARGNGRAHRA
jgi:hypothetical protein